MMDNSGIDEWRLANFKCFREPASLPKTTVTEVQETESETGVWHTRKDHTAAPLVVRISNFAHLAVLQGDQLVESYFMILAKKWIKAILVGKLSTPLFDYNAEK